MNSANSASESFLQDFHREHPGCTSIFLRGFSTDGLNSYEHLATKIATDGERLRILDLACGDGTLFEVISKRRISGIEAAGLDMSKDELAAARKKTYVFPTKFLQGKAQALPFEESSLDLVFCHMAFMLMDSPEQVLAEIRRVLKPGGSFSAIVGGTQQNPDQKLWKKFREILTASFQQEESAKPVPIGDPRARTAAGLTELFKGAGFQETDIQDIALRFEGPLDEMIVFFTQTYSPSFLSSEGRNKFLQALMEAFREETDEQGRISFQMHVLQATGKK